MTILVAMGAGAYLYFVLMRYERIAARHIPRGSVVAARWDVEQAVLYDPLRRHILPIVDERLSLASGSAAKPDGLNRLEGATKINLGRDLREVAFARGPNAADWVLVLGGMFTREGVIEGLATLLSERGQSWQFHAHGRTATGPHGLALGQSGDGALLIASSLERLEAALEPSAEGERLGLGADYPAGLAIDATVRAQPEGAAARRLRAVLLLGDPIEVDLVGDVVVGAPRDRVARDLRTWLGGVGSRTENKILLQLPQALPIADLGPNRVTGRFEWGRADIDASAQAVAAHLRELWVASPGPPPP